MKQIRYGAGSLHVLTSIAMSALVCCISQGCIHDTAQVDDQTHPFAKGETVAIIKSDDLREASGMAVSGNNRDMMWVHNDSGNGTELFLLDLNGTVLEVYHIGNGAINRDWEDMAIGPGPAGSGDLLYIADIGDNAGVREIIRVYVVPEPNFGQQDKRITGFQVLRFEYPDHPRDAEALMLDPVANQLIIVTKRDERSIVYTAPITTSGAVTPLDSILTLPFNYVTAGEISRDGREILIKTYDAVYYWQREPNKTLGETLLKTPLTLPYDPEPQGEAIAWNPDVSGYYTTSEKKGSRPQQVLFYPRR